MNGINKTKQKNDQNIKLIILIFEVRNINQKDFVVVAGIVINETLIAPSEKKPIKMTTDHSFICESERQYSKNCL